MFRVMENQVVLGDIVPQNEAMRVLHLLLWEYQKKLRTDDLKYFYYTLSSMMMEKCLIKEYVASTSLILPSTRLFSTKIRPHLGQRGSCTSKALWR